MAAEIVLRIFDGATSKPLARVVSEQGRLAVEILRSGRVSKTVPLGDGDQDGDESVRFHPVRGVRMAMSHTEIRRAITEGHTAIGVDHPSSGRMVLGYRIGDGDTKRALEVQLAAETEALDFWVGKGSPGMVALFTERVAEAREAMQALARSRRDTPKPRRRR